MVAGLGPLGSHGIAHASFRTHTWGPFPLSWTRVHRGIWFAWSQLIRDKVANGSPCHLTSSS